MPRFAPVGGDGDHVGERPDAGNGGDDLECVDVDNREVMRAVVGDEQKTVVRSQGEPVGLDADDDPREPVQRVAVHVDLGPCHRVEDRQRVVQSVRDEDVTGVAGGDPLVGLIAERAEDPVQGVLCVEDRQVIGALIRDVSILRAG